jgi:hypothetical protein
MLNRSERLQWLKTELYKFLNRNQDLKRKRVIFSAVQLRFKFFGVRGLAPRFIPLIDTINSVEWYLVRGFSIGFSIEELLYEIKDNEVVFNISKSFSIESILKGKPLPAFYIGDEVEVILNESNRTDHRGFIHERGWHVKDKQWYYYIVENNKPVKKRYFEHDLNLIIKSI